MPSERMDGEGLSSPSFFPEEVFYPNERQVGFWKTETMPDHYIDIGVKVDGILGTAGGNSAASSPLEKRMSPESHQRMQSCDLPDPTLTKDQKVNYSFLKKHAVGAERAASQSFRIPVDHIPEMRSNLNAKPASYFMEGDEIHVMGPQYENGLFSSSLSELFGRKLRLTSNNALYGHSVGAAASHYEDQEPFETLEEIEAQTIGNLLPNDDDLLSGVTDGLDYVGQSNPGEEIEDLDFFSSVGGMDLGEDGFPPGQRDSEFSEGSFSSVGVDQHYREHPSRTLFVRNINSNVEDSELQALFEQFGDIHTLYTACKHRGFVMIAYYDIRASQNAMRALQNKPLRRRNLDIHFSIPKENPSEKYINHGILVVFNLDSSVSNEELHQIFGVYGEIEEIREAPQRGHHRFIEFYDVRAAEAALHALNRSDIAGKKIKLEPSPPVGARRCLMPQFPSDMEQDESGPYLHHCSSPSNSTTGFHGPVSHAGITSSCMDNGTVPGVHPAIRAPISGPFMENAFHQGLSSSVPNSLSSLVRVESLGNQSSFPESGHSQRQLKVGFQGTPDFHPHSFLEYHDSLTNGAQCNSPVMDANVSARPCNRNENRQFCKPNVNAHSLELNDAGECKKRFFFGFSGNGSCPSPGHHYMWSNSPQPQGMMWPNSPTFVNGVCTGHPPPGLHGQLSRAPSQMLNTILPMNNHHVGSAPSANPSLWDRPSYAGESPNASGFHPGSLGNMRISGNSPHHLEFVSQNIFPHVGGNCMDLPIPSQNVGLQSHHQRCMMFPGRGQMIPMMSSFDSPNERARSRRSEASSNQGDNKKQFELDVDRIMRGEDNRTTLMIKNIPNKYVVPNYLFILFPRVFQMFFSSDENKCNVGYAFINMTDPSMIIPFYQAFNGKKWEKFNSEKVATLAYARIQGKVALIAHFQNSSLMNEDKRCRPILFNTDGPNAGDQVPFPMGVNIRSRPSKTRAITSEENHQESALNLPNGEEFVNGGLSSD
ncbi:hypothetical protein RHGRI_034082 [Rhododendron griersonianum]|uniref:RRM domain-containing protein n=1 Tax=Rhododendron griersonianum TaxID=479676 RepID=A0AAV6I008_9ERIC|nr:hypothetical protein RHGRI_034082 [Rhododendron griersonianum]